ncbi:D-alanyl-D-alanine carboxypeptidase DacA [bioreactor metagenome]|uniref:D-alanyl-D-alanine carboxypeptidase DacA n=1 Tax=bioreactor metagenome TaxID=1076179 RepID=A0A644YYE0_9ZZZZ
MDSQALLNWGFRFHETHRLYEAGKALASPKVWKGEEDEVQLGVAQPLLVTTARGKYDRLKATMDLPKSLVAPIAKGQKIGTLKVMLGTEQVGAVPLEALEDVPEAGIFGRAWDAIRLWIK